MHPEGLCLGAANIPPNVTPRLFSTLAEVDRDQDRLLDAPSEVAPLLALGSIDTLRSALMSLAPNPAFRSQGLHNVQHLGHFRQGWYLPAPTGLS